MLIGLDTVSIGEPSARLADPLRANHAGSGVGNFSDRVWGVIRDRYHLAHVKVERHLGLCKHRLQSRDL